MGLSKYFTVKVKPTITASLQTGVFTAGDVVWDWTSFEVPKGTNRIIGATLMVRGTNGTGAATNQAGFEIYFASTNDNSLGTLNATANGTGYYNDLIGYIDFAVSDYGDHLDNMAVADSASRRNVLIPKTPEVNKAGYDTFYVGGISITSSLPSWISTVTCTGVQPITQAVLTVGTTSALTNFAVGDVLHDEDDRLMGTVKSMDSATQMTMEDNLANATVNAKDLYNINPITLLLHFEV